MLAKSEVGKAIIASARSAYVIGPDLHSPVHGVVLAMRQVEGRYLPITDCLLWVMDGHSMITLIKQHGLNGALQQLRELRSQIVQEENQRLILILTSMQGIIAEQKKKRRVGMKWMLSQTMRDDV